jgi:hypothetical protein
MTVRWLILILCPLLLGANPPERRAPEAVRLRGSVAVLVGFGTRHTLSQTDSPRRGIGAARRWAAQQFGQIGEGCGHCLVVETIGAPFSGPRAPSGVQVEDVVAVQRGTDKAGPVIIIQAHIDSRVSDIMNATADAPGANDDGSGVALVLEAARQLTMQKLPATLVYAILSGEEQGLWGGKLLADTARARGWKVAAVLNNDIVGNSHGIGGEFLPHRVRVFSAGGPDSDDTPSRALAKAVKQIAAAKPDIGLEVVAIRRADRIQRGGDHLPFLEGGFPAVRFTEAAEHYDHQHQDVRTEKGKAYGDTIDAMDFAYLARVTALNVRVVGTLARAPAPPAAVSIAGAVSDDTQISWSDVRGAAGYRIYWRRADGFDWTNHRDVPAMTTTLVLKAVNIDDNVFGVAARSSGGEASLVSFAKPAEHRP